MSLRRPHAGLALAAALAAAALVLPPSSASASGGPVATGPLADRACAEVTHPQLLRIWRGTRAGRTGEILIVPREPNYVSGGRSHSGPWGYLQRVPLLFVGPGYVPAGVRVDRAVTLASVAPTLSDLVGSEDFEAPDGTALQEALVLEAERPGPPRLVVVVVWDGGGRNVLARWPEMWPNLERLQGGGVWFDGALLGSSPSVTTPVHATIGTGAFARRHGLTDSQIRSGEAVVDSWSAGPVALLEPTLADVFDLEVGNEPLVANVATAAWHLGMIGHGALHPGGDADVAVAHQEVSGFAWNLREDLRSLYAFPDLVNEVGGHLADLQELDLADGADDGLWRDNEILALGRGFATPARNPFQTRTIEALIDQLGFGADEVPDLLYTNYKVIDGTGHRFGMNSLEEKDTVLWTDRELPELERIMEEAAPGRWVLVLTADHGLNPGNPAAWPIGVGRLLPDLAAAFDDGDGRRAIQKVRPTQAYLDTEELVENGHTLADVARFLNGYTKGENAAAPGDVPSAHRGDEVFAAAFPRALLARLPCLPEARA